MTAFGEVSSPVAGLKGGSKTSIGEHEEILSKSGCQQKPQKLHLKYLLSVKGKGKSENINVSEEPPPPSPTTTCFVSLLPGHIVLGLAPTPSAMHASSVQPPWRHIPATHGEGAKTGICTRYSLEAADGFASNS